MIIHCAISALIGSIFSGIIFYKIGYRKGYAKSCEDSQELVDEMMKKLEGEPVNKVSKDKVEEIVENAEAENRNVQETELSNPGLYSAPTSRTDYNKLYRKGNTISAPSDNPSEDEYHGSQLVSRSVMNENLERFEIIDGWTYYKEDDTLADMNDIIRDQREWLGLSIAATLKDIGDASAACVRNPSREMYFDISIVEGGYAEFNEI